MIGMRQKRFNFIARIFNRNDNTSVTIIAPIVQACREMSAHKTGALIVIGRQSDLRLITEGGIAIDAKISTPLLENIFFKNAPLHDGAVVIEGDRIVAAKCILPVTQSDVPKSYGTRHRAAIGMSEISDAIILVVPKKPAASRSHTAGRSTATSLPISWPIYYNVISEPTGKRPSRDDG